MGLARVMKSYLATYADRSSTLIGVSCPGIWGNSRNEEIPSGVCHAVDKLILESVSPWLLDFVQFPKLRKLIISSDYRCCNLSRDVWDSIWIESELLNALPNELISKLIQENDHLIQFQGFLEEWKELSRTVWTPPLELRKMCCVAIGRAAWGNVLRSVIFFRKCTVVWVRELRFCTSWSRRTVVLSEHRPCGQQGMCLYWRVQTVQVAFLVVSYRVLGSLIRRPCPCRPATRETDRCLHGIFGWSTSRPVIHWET